jgi:uncharacterized protein YbjQ (UPF0145 family)
LNDRRVVLQLFSMAGRTVFLSVWEDPMSTSQAPLSRGVQPQFVTTAFEIDGYEIVNNLGVVRGITVRSRSIFGTIGAGLQTLVGGNITLLSELCEKTRLEAFNLMIKHGSDIGANAIIGARYDATEIMQGVTEVLAYGTAVVIRPKSQ